jgi:hypothetical protein
LNSQNIVMRTPRFLIFLLKSIALPAALVVLSSCAADKEIVMPPPAPPVPAEPKPPMTESHPAPSAPAMKASLQCLEDTKKIFNRCGIDASPFLRATFYDTDGDGIEEMVVGGKDGALRLFKNYGTRTDPDWKVIENYFRGISAGAFASPAVGDIDNDGKPEVMVGTGGFSSDSGRVLFFRNIGTVSEPRWERAGGPEIRVGNDAAPTLLQTDKSGRPDLVVGNSEGGLFLFRNGSKDGKILFGKGKRLLGGARLGMYAAPAAAGAGGRAVIVAGNDMGKLYLIEKADGNNGAWTKTLLKISTPGFASPALMKASDTGGLDLVVSDGDGQIYYYKNRRGNYREWEASSGPFTGRILPGPACSPQVADNGRGRVITVGNIHGEMKLYSQDAPGADLPVEKKEFFRGLKLTGFSKGVLAEWQGKPLLITGQQDGVVRAFLNSGSSDRPAWAELRHFFRGIPKMMHASPVVFDLEGSGKWDLIVGDAEGYVRGFRYEIGPGGMPQWEEIKGTFDEVKVAGYAAPSLFREGDMLSMLVGEQDGRIRVFEAGTAGSTLTVFHGNGFLKDISVKNHSSPSAIAKEGIVELAIGDYDGNLKHYSCNMVFVEVTEKSGEAR